MCEYEGDGNGTESVYVKEKREEMGEVGAGEVCIMYFVHGMWFSCGKLVEGCQVFCFSRGEGY